MSQNEHRHKQSFFRGLRGMLQKSASLMLLMRMDRMMSINNATLFSFTPYFQPRGQSAKPQEGNGDNLNKIVIGVPPGKANGASGDRCESPFTILIFPQGDPDIVYIVLTFYGIVAK